MSNTGIFQSGDSLGHKTDFCRKRSSFSPMALFFFRNRRENFFPAIRFDRKQPMIYVIGECGHGDDTMKKIIKFSVAAAGIAAGIFLVLQTNPLDAPLQACTEGNSLISNEQLAMSN